MRHGQIGEGFQDAGEFADCPVPPKQRPRQAQHPARGGGERLDQLKCVRLRTISLINQTDSTPVTGKQDAEVLIAEELTVSLALPLSYNSLFWFSSSRNSS